jgi:hypothetical protein
VKGATEAKTLELSLERKGNVQKRLQATEPFKANLCFRRWKPTNLHCQRGLESSSGEINPTKMQTKASLTHLEGVEGPKSDPICFWIFAPFPPPRAYKSTSQSTPQTT